MQQTAEDNQQYFPAYQPWLVWGSAAFFFFFQFVVRISPSVFLDDMVRDLEISACELGGLSSSYYVGYSSVQLFVGVLLDRIGVRIPLTAAALIVSAGCYIFSFSTDLTVLSWTRFFIGVGSALGFLSCVKTASMWFTSDKIGFLVGTSVFIGMMGATFGGYPMAYLVEMVGWRGAMVFLSAIAAFIALNSFLVVRDREQAILAHDEVEEEEVSILESLAIILKNPQTYLYAFFGMAMYAPFSGFADLWGPKFLSLVYNVDRLQAAGSVSMIFIGVGLSGPLQALVAERLQSYKKVMMAGATVSLLAYLMVIFIKLPLFILTYPFFIVVGFALGSQFFAFACIIEINPRKVSATASGLQNMVSTYGGGAAIYIVGYILDYVSDGELDGTISDYGIPEFQMALLAIPAFIAIAPLMLSFARDAYPKAQKTS